MPVEFEKYFEKEYAKLKKEAKTYEELKKLIDAKTQEAIFQDTEWGKLLNKNFNKLFQREFGSLSIQ